MSANELYNQNLAAIAKGRSYLLRVLKALPELRGAYLDESGLQGQNSENLDGCKILVIHGFDESLGEWLKVHGESYREIVIVEPNPQRVRAVLEKQDFTHWFARGEFEVLTGLFDKNLETALIQYLRARHRVTLSRSVGHLRLKGTLQTADVQSFKEIFDKAVQIVFSANRTVDEDNYVGLSNILENRHALAAVPHIDIFRGAFSGKPALVVAAGPSLDLHIEFLNKYQDRFVIVATDGALAALIKADIRPSLAVTMERTWDIRKILERLPKAWQLPVILLPNITPAALKADNFSPILMLRASTFGAWFWPAKTQFETGSNVAAMAIRFLNYAGASRISLLGQDLAYDRRTKNSHYAGQDEVIANFEMGKLESGLYSESEGNNGEPIPSQKYWDMFRQEIEYFISTGMVPTQNVIPRDCGAKIANAERVDPETFWQEASSLAVQSIAVDISERLKLAKPDAGQLDQLAETVVRLKAMHRLATESVQSITLGDLENMPVTFDEGEMKAIRLHFAKSKKRMLTLMESDPDLFFNLLGCLVYPQTIQTLYDLENNQLEPGKAPDYCERETLLIHGWFKDVSHWAQRLYWLMGKHVS